MSRVAPRLPLRRSGDRPRTHRHEDTVGLVITLYLGMYSSGRHAMNEARLSHLPFWGPSEAGFFFLN